jgi:hypothetical protein
VSKPQELIRKGASPAQRLLKARILLKADASDAGEAWSDRKIIEALDTSVSMVYRVRKQLVEEGLDAVLSRKQRATPPVAPIFDGEKEARLIALACSTPPEGYALDAAVAGREGRRTRHRRSRQRQHDWARAQKNSLKPAIERNKSASALKQKPSTHESPKSISRSSRLDALQLELRIPLEALGSPWQSLCCSNPTPAIYLCACG